MTVPLAPIPPEDSPYHKERPAVQRAWLATDRMLSDPPTRFTRWLDNRGFDEVPERTLMRRFISRNLERQGLKIAASNWRIQAADELRSFKLKCLPTQVAKEIAWRLVELVASELDPMVSQRRTKVMRLPPEQQPVPAEAIEGMEFLPEWMRWAVMHPGLLLTDEEVKADPVLQTAVDRYLELYPCPHQAALHQLNIYRGNIPALHKMFTEIGKLHITASRKADVPIAEENVAEPEQEETAEQRKIQTLASLFEGGG